MKAKLLSAFKAELKVYPWASDEAKLAKFMAAAQETLEGGNQIDREGSAFKAALIKCGLPPKIPLKILHCLCADKAA